MAVIRLVTGDPVRSVLERCHEAERAGRLTTFVSCFAPAAVLEDGGRRCAGRDAILRAYEQLRSRPRAAGTPRWPVVQREVTDIEVRLLQNGEAHGTSEFVARTPDGVDHRGRYVDRMRLVGDRWLIVHRQVVVTAASGTSPLRAEARRSARRAAGVRPLRPVAAGSSAPRRPRRLVAR